MRASGQKQFSVLATSVGGAESCRVPGSTLLEVDLPFPAGRVHESSTWKPEQTRLASSDEDFLRLTFIGGDIEAGKVGVTAQRCHSQRHAGVLGGVPQSRLGPQSRGSEEG